MGTVIPPGGSTGSLPGRCIVHPAGWHIAAAAGVALLALAAGCAGDAGVIAEISGEPVMQAEFDVFVQRTLQDGAAGADEAPSDELLSRLLERFLDEELIIREARRRGLTVSQQEIADEMRFIQMPAEAATDGSAEKKAAADAHRSLILRKFREEHVLATVEVNDEEISAYYGEHRDHFQQPTRLVLRQILLDDEEQARRMREELWKDPSRFAEAAEQSSLAPDGGKPMAYEMANLPPEIIESVEAVEEGQVSRVSVSPEGFRIFLVEKREAARQVSMEEAAERIRVILMQEKSRRAYEEMLAALRARSGVVIHRESLSFKYEG